MLFGDLWAHYSLRLGKVESENPRCSAAEKCGHFSGFVYFRDVEIVETSIDGRVRAPFQSVGTLSFSSSNQFRTILILRGVSAADSPSVAWGGFIIRNRLPSELMSHGVIS